jgi:probable rRNA maturation factor
MTAAARARLKIDVIVDAAPWKKASPVRSILRRTVTEAATALSTSAAGLAIVLTDDSAIRSLNRLWRGTDAATNVLSFPGSSFPSSSSQNAAVPQEPFHLGDIVLAYETIAREARAERKPFIHHVAHLALHGFLHLLGHDHELDTDAEEMEGLERDILRRLKIPDPYRPRVKSKVRKSRSKVRRSK